MRQAIRHRTTTRNITRLRMRTQRQIVRDVMLSAAECDTWLTLAELARLTRFGEASISAQLRHLRKPECGGFQIKKRVRAALPGRPPQAGSLWEYRLFWGRRRSRKQGVRGAKSFGWRKKAGSARGRERGSEAGAGL